MITLAVILLLLSNSQTAGQVTNDNWFTVFDPLFKKYADYYGLDWKFLKAFAMNEAGLGVVAGGIEKSVLAGLQNPANVEGSKSYDGKSWGLMQMTLKTAADYDSSVTPEKLNSPEYSINLASQLIAWLSLRFNESDPRYLEWIAKSYNQGIGNTQKERAGGTGYADQYWERFQRNYAKV